MGGNTPADYPHRLLRKGLQLQSGRETGGYLLKPHLMLFCLVSTAPKQEEPLHIAKIMFTFCNFRKHYADITTKK